MLTQANDRLGLSGRGYFRVLRVARTTTELAQNDIITANRIAEALAFRPVVCHL